MKLTPHKINKNNNFIDGWYFNNKKICNDLIKFFEKNKSCQSAGKVGQGEVDTKIKNSTDICLKDHLQNPIVISYLTNLKKVLEEYKKKYIYCDKSLASWKLYDKFNIQKYLPNQGFYAWHTERASLLTQYRHLTFMTYLNDIDDDGETEWYYQKLKVKPEKGLTIIWGSDWTFTHRGVPSKTQTKYIITGWYVFENTNIFTK